MNSDISLAILYQAQPPPPKDGIVKPMKPGGYSDSGADIAYALKNEKISIVTPVDNPSIDKNLDWVFPDTPEGIEKALSLGANTLWLNTILYAGHPVEKYIERGIGIVGQIPAKTDLYDDKWITNELLRKNGLPIPEALLVDSNNLNNFTLGFPYPVVAKPIRGRGSEGVQLANNKEELAPILKDMFSADKYGTAVYVEEFLEGQEVTITVMPPGTYAFESGEQEKSYYWSLPAVKRFGHHNGVAPYNGTVAVVNNSQVLDDEELNSEGIQNLYRQCEKAAELVGSKAAIRIDCRADKNGNYYLFDLNMKPNMTGASRPARKDQDCLSALAARKIGWDFTNLLVNMLRQRWFIK